MRQNVKFAQFDGGSTFLAAVVLEPESNIGVVRRLAMKSCQATLADSHRITS